MEEKKLTGYPSIDKPWLKYYSEEARNAPLPECTVFELLWKNNKDHLDDIALNYYGRKITYGQMFENIERVAKAFSALGVKQGDIVVICTVNTPEMVYAFYALNQLGAISNMIDPRTNVDGIREYILESDARLAMTINLAYPAIKKAMNGTAVEKVIVVSPADSLPPVTKVLYQLKTKSPKLDAEALVWKDFIALGNSIEPKYASYKKDTCCVMAHTGGTTGFPKGVMLTNDNLNAVVHGYWYIGIPFERQQRYFNDLPPFIMYGLCLATHTTLCYGQEVILYPVFDSKGFPKQFAKYKPHHFSAVADHLKYLANDKATKNMDLSFLITAAAGGDAVPREVEEDVSLFLQEHGCKYEVVKGFGMTELAATAVTSCQNANAIGSVGIPLIQNNVKIVNVDTLQELGYEETGEIWISGPSLMLGYYKKPKETAEIFVTDECGIRWIRTGDLGHITKEGLLFHEGRIRRIYVTSFENQPAKIFPMVIESAVKQSEAVSECSVVGKKRRDSDFCDAVAFVVKKDKSQSDDVVSMELTSICKASVPSYMVPIEYRYIDEIPHTPIGKVDFRSLEKEAEHLS